MSYADEKFLEEITNPDIYNAQTLVDVLVVITSKLAVAEFRMEECDLGRRDKNAVLHEIYRRLNRSNIK